MVTWCIAHPMRAYMQGEWKGWGRRIEYIDVQNRRDNGHSAGSLLRHAKRNVRPVAASPKWPQPSPISSSGDHRSALLTSKLPPPEKRSDVPFGKDQISIQSSATCLAGWGIWELTLTI